MKVGAIFANFRWKAWNSALICSRGTPERTRMTTRYAIFVVGADGDGSVDIGVLPGEANREYADDRVELVVEADGFAEYVSPTEEMALPEDDS